MEDHEDERQNYFRYINYSSFQMSKSISYYFKIKYIEEEEDDDDVTDHCRYTANTHFTSITHLCTLNQPMKIAYLFLCYCLVNNGMEREKN